MRVAMAQLDQRVGDPAANASAILDAVASARRAGARLVVTPELSLCGCPSGDLPLRPALVDTCARELAALAAGIREEAVVVGFPERADGALYNAAAVLRAGKVERIYRKQALPGRAGFDEARCFARGRQACVFDVDGLRAGLAIGEDAWHPEAAAQARAAGAQLLAVSNGSPWHTDQHADRRAAMEARAREAGLPVVHVNRVGGQDGLVFDGASFVLDATGALAQQLPAWHECLAIAEVEAGSVRPVRGELDTRVEPHLYDALVMGVRDYVGKNGFAGAFVAVSGGVDSALTLAVAVDALGRERVRAVMRPSRDDAPARLEEARATAALHAIVPGTGNEHAGALGYATLGGEEAGAFAVLEDVGKPLVDRLCAYRNRLGRVIPQRVIDHAAGPDRAVAGQASASRKRVDPDRA